MKKWNEKENEEKKWKKMKMKKIYCVISGNYRKFKNPAFLKKH